MISTFGCTAKSLRQQQIAVNEGRSSCELGPDSRKTAVAVRDKETRKMGTAKADVRVE